MKKSDELKKRADLLERDLAAKKEEYTNLIADGKSTGKLAAEMTEMESELAGTRNAVKVLQERETKEAEKERLAYAEKMKKQIEVMRESAKKQNAEVINSLIDTLNKLGELSRTIAGANNLITSYAPDVKRLGDVQNLIAPLFRAGQEINGVLAHAAAYGGDQETANKFRNALERI